MTQTMDAVTHSVLVPLAPDAAFELFVDRFDTWWPREGHKLLEQDLAEVVIEPREGGRWYERAVDGSECDWGYVTELDPPKRIVLAWHLDPQFDFDPDPAKATTVEVSFNAEEDQTRVTLGHSGFEVHGEAGAGMRQAVGGDGGWSHLLALYRDAA
jgi:uncharacterized protein YndB with AHSA1/START domain